ncbi:MAG TPA: metallophosphoesterase [Mycobacteriales bacterium]|nr:metallophosphoesterase [Mycobacteriales bacterium]
MRRTLAWATGIAGLAVSGASYAVIEARSPRLRQIEVRILPPGSRPLRILHISDLHITPGQEWKIRWLRDLAGLDPDLVADTGDNLAHRDAVASVARALEPLLERPGVFVGGSNDYFAPRWKNPARYLLPNTGRRVHGRPLPYADLRRVFLDAGWVDLTNRRVQLDIAGHRIDAAGVNDPHIKADRYPKVAGPVAAGADLGLALVHAPEPRILDEFAADGFGLVLAGHTHGGQLRVPGIGALVTNCGLETRRARGLSRWGSSTWLHVSAGLGTSPFAPVRFACPPEATLLTVQPA